MIEFHVVVEKEDKHDIERRVENGKFELRGTYSTRNGRGWLFVILADEEEIVALRLKYGKDKVWKR